jgi:hypothetical protein
MSQQLMDGFKTLITFASAPTVKFYEKRITPPGASMGGPNDTTTMRNTAWRTRQPKKLKTLDNATATVSWDPIVYSTVVNTLLGLVDSITITFPDGSTLQFYGWLDEFRPNEITEGEQPTATVTICPSNQTAVGVEAAPVLTPS